MEYNCLDVDLSRISAEDETFKISTHSSAAELADSIKHIGLINKPILVGQNDRYIVVSGFARVRACGLLGWNQIPARCLSPESPLTRNVLIAIADNAAQRPLNIVEQARAFHLLSMAFKDQADLLQAADWVGLAVNSDLADKLLIVYQMSDHLKQGLLYGTIALPIALRLSAMADDESAQALGSFVIDLDLSLNRQRELLDWIEAIAHREQVSVEDILADSQLMEWRNDRQMDRPQRSLHIRQYLKKRRYPTLSDVEQRYADALKKINIQKGVQLIPPPHFEGQTFSLQLTFSSQDQLNQRVKEIQRLTESSAFKEILEQRFIA